MITPKEIALTNLLLDTANPRLVNGVKAQRDALHAMLQDRRAKVPALAASIARLGGLNPSERMLVMPAPDSPGKYVVLEGNRRITALKVLARPSLARDAVSAAMMRRFEAMSAQMKGTPVIRVDCAVAESRAEARPWIELRHRGEQGGRGVVDWGTIEQGRFDARQEGGVPPIELQALDLVAEHGKLSAETVNLLPSFPATNLRRLLRVKEVREMLGLELDGKHLISRLPRDEYMRPLTYLVEQLAHGELDVSRIYTKPLMLEYLGNLPAGTLPTLSKAGEVAHALWEDPSSGTDASGGIAARQPKVRITRPRSALIPSTCVLDTNANPKVHGIERELRTLKLESYRNAASVLFRVFLELSVDEFIESRSLMTPQQWSSSNLSFKILSAVNRMKADGALSDLQIDAVRKTAQDQVLFVASVNTFHAYVHNKHVAPSAGDLRVTWDNLQPFFERLWPAT